MPCSQRRSEQSPPLPFSSRKISVMIEKVGGGAVETLGKVAIAVRLACNKTGSNIAALMMTTDHTRSNQGRG